MSEAAALRLADVLMSENAALSALDLRAAAGLVAEKEAALAGFAARDPAWMPDLALAGRLRALAAENRTLLERAILVQGRVLGTIARAARRPAQRYNRAGIMATGEAPAFALLKKC